MPKKPEPLLPILRSNKVQITIFPNDGTPRRPPFVASFETKTEKDKLDPCMNQLLAWQFGRLYDSERQAYVKNDDYKQTRQIPNDYGWWLKKRSHVIDRRALYTQRHLRGKAADAVIPNLHLSAFAVPKLTRPLRIMPPVKLKPSRKRKRGRGFGRARLRESEIEEINKKYNQQFEDIK